MSQFSMLQLFFLVTFIQIAVGSQMYIAPSPTSQCPNGVESCFTLSALATNASDFLDSNMTQLVFLEGIHTIDKDLIISHVEFLTLHTSSSFSASVSCSEGAHINFINITNVQISGLEFIGCSSSVEFVEQFSLEFSKFHGGSNGSALQLTQTSANISQSSFTCNTVGIFQSYVEFLEYVYLSTTQTFLKQSHSARIGGALVVTSSNLHISNSQFDSNKAEVGGAIFSQMGSNVTITDSTFLNNSARGCRDHRCHGGALFVDRACNVQTANNIFMNNTSEVGGGVITLFQGILFDNQNIFIGNSANSLGGVISAYDRSIITIQSSTYRSTATKAVRLGYSKSGVIHIKSQCKIIVYNSSFDNSNLAFVGGVMYASSNSGITVYNSSFSNSVAAGNGGVMFASSSNIYVYDSSFNNNEARTLGGVMYAYSSSGITVYNSYFNRSVSAVNGGVMYASSSSKIYVYNSSFDNSEAHVFGGVMYASYTSIITVYNSSFENNEASSRGGVLCAYFGSSITVHYSSFDSGKAGNEGGVMFASFNSSIDVYDSSFCNNKAGRNGGVMHASFNSNIDFYKSSFYNNKAGRNGGIMHASSNSNVTVYNSSFDNNEAGFAGGVAYASSSSSIWVYGSSFDHSTAGREGGVIYTYFSNISVCNSSFENSDAGSNGGVIYSSFSSSVTVYDSFFDNSVAGSDGGVMYAHYTSSIAVYNSKFINNKASRDSGVMFTDTSNFNMYNSFFDNSEAYRYGGVIYASSSNVTVYKCSFENNQANSGGVLYAESSSIITMYNSSFDNNNANNTGGVVYETSRISSCFIPSSIQSLHSVSTNVTFKNKCVFTRNSASEGGVIYVYLASLIDFGSLYQNNVARLNGGVAAVNESVAKVSASTFVNNTAGDSGGVLFTPTHFRQTQIALENSKFDNNRAIKGGALAIFTNEILTVTKSSFTHNHARKGGALYLLTGNVVTLSYCKFFQNSAERDGGVIYSDNQNKLIMNNNKMNFNIAKNNGGVVCSLAQTYVNISGEECTFMQNQAHSGGAIYARESNVDVHSRSILLVSNTAEETGGAVHLSEASLTSFCDSGRVKESEAELGAASNEVTLVGNGADQGGAIYASESRVLIDILCSQTHINANSARKNGGGLYLTMSELIIRGYSSSITRNRAGNSGGGIHADKSCITIEGAVLFVNNEAGNGGGVSLERYTKFYGTRHHSNMDFMSNMAHYYGGAVYVNDETNQDMCVAVNAENTTLTNECFFSTSLFMKLWNNSAGISGFNIFGGLLDRCKVHNKRLHKSKTNGLRPSGIDSFLSSSNISYSQLDTISSHPVQLCFCRDSQPDCDYQPELKRVNRGTTFLVEIIAYNQVHETVNANIHSSLSSSAGGLDEGQDIQEISNSCTELHFEIFSPRNLHELTLSIEKPCRVAGISQKSLTIEITCTCPIGFEPLSNALIPCDCVCHQVLQPYVETQCNATSKTIIRSDNFWIDYNINQSGYIIYPNCPYDYCQPPEEHVLVNLSIPEGSDAQCASNRSGTLCGTCRPGFSVSLGSSSCLRCPQYWPGLLVAVVTAFILSGIGLVALILVLNLTVAIGTLNAVIFYANIMAANKSALFPTSELSFASVFISWLNFDLGIDTCFFDGMDTYIKTWLQLAFPAYIIILVIIIIQLSYRSVRFGRLIGKKDPAATLATLVLLSYAKLLQIIITTFSSATLHYPNNSNKTVWLPDASVGYFSFKHAVLFFTTIVILLFSLVYTFLLLTWQWFLYCPRKRSVWVKLSSFLEMYHVPYNQKHRYWTGLLLLVRVAVYLVSAFNPSNDPRIALLSTSFIVSCLFFYMTVFGIKMYKNWFTNTLEIFTYFNISMVSMFTWYSFDSDNTNRSAIANISVGATFVQLILIIFYHAYNHVNKKLLFRIQETMCYVKIKERLRKQRGSDHLQLPDDDIHHFHELLDVIDRPVNTNDYNEPQIKPVEPTMSVVELPKPHLASWPQLEEIQVELHPQPSEEDSKTAQEEIITSPTTNETKTSFDDCSAEEIPEFTMHPTSTVYGKRRTILMKTCFPENTGSRQEEPSAPKP